MALDMYIAKSNLTIASFAQADSSLRPLLIYNQ
jgi:hypothetical protein